jgi:hypothetical protein
VTSLEIERFIKKFENGELKEDEWHHREHLLMTLWYLTQTDELTAIVKIKQGILRYNVLYNVPQIPGRGYHETITMFFIKYVQQVISRNKGSSWDELVKSLLSDVSYHMSLLKKYYNNSTLHSVKARVHWIEPDLQSLE